MPEENSPVDCFRRRGDVHSEETGLYAEGEALHYVCNFFGFPLNFLYFFVCFCIMILHIPVIYSKEELVFTTSHSARVPAKAPKHPVLVKSVKSFIFLICFLAVFSVFCIPMGVGNAINTLMNTAYDLLISTVFKIMAIAVIAGAISELLSEYGVVELLNRILSPLMKPLFGMPGASALGVVTTYLSDNPAILALAEDKKFRSFFRKYQVPALTNLGTAFGMGLIVTSFMLTLSNRLGGQVALAALCGNLGAIIGAIVSTRLMLLFMKKAYGKEAPAVPEAPEEEETADEDKPRGFLRILNSLLEGGKKGVDLGLSIIPGVLLICSLVMMLSGGMPDGGYSGGAYEGIGILPLISDKLGFILKPLFGFSSNGAVAVPVTALGSAGAALTIVEDLVKNNAATCNDIAVFTAICMCWSGYLSTHVSMMDALKCNRHTGKAILCHTVGGFIAGIAAHWLFVLFTL